MRSFGRSISIALAFAILGLAGLAVSWSHKASADVTGSPAVKCNENGPCLKEDNRGNGFGIEGSSRLGSGIEGTTKYNSVSTGQSGVLGVDASTSGSLNDGVLGTSSIGTGVAGVAAAGAGVHGSSTSRTRFGVGVVGDGPEAVDGNGSFLGGNSFGIGVYATGGSPTLIAQSVYPAGSGITIFDALDNGANSVAYLDDFGNLYLTGKVYTSGSCSTGCIPTKTSTGHQVISYAPRETEPTMEDFGSGVMTLGKGVVRLDASFAHVIDGRSGYYVFLTPHADSRGLYVNDETSSGFVVRENADGKDSLTFDYRIVAKPYDMVEERLPKYTTHTFGVLGFAKKFDQHGRQH